MWLKLSKLIILQIEFKGVRLYVENTFKKETFILITLWVIKIYYYMMIIEDWPLD